MDIVPQLVANSIIAGALYSIVALGFNLVYGTVKFFDIGYGALIAAGAYAVFYFSKILGLPLASAIFLGIAITALLYFLMYTFVYTPLRRRQASSMVLLVASLGLFTAIQALIAMLFTSQSQTLYRETTFPEVITFAGGSITSIQLGMLAAAVLILIVLVLIFKYTLFGKAVRAIGDDEEVAKIVGVHTEKVIGGVFLIAGAIAAVSGIFVGYDTVIEPTMGMGLFLKGVIASIVGGIGNVYGAVLGAFLLGFVENFGIWKIPGEWKDAIAFALLIGFLAFRPQGILRK